jgi:hypothetical protein
MVGETTCDKPLELIHPNAVKELESCQGPPIDSDEGKQFMHSNGFNYCAIVGEIVYPYVLFAILLQYLPCSMPLYCG